MFFLFPSILVLMSTAPLPVCLSDSPGQKGMSAYCDAEIYTALFHYVTAKRMESVYYSIIDILAGLFVPVSRVEN